MTYDLDFSFEELPLDRFTDSAGRVWDLSIHAAGTALISYDDLGEWELRGLEIATFSRGASGWDDGKCRLEESSPLYPLIANALLARHNGDIELDVEEALRGDGTSLPHPNEERRLGARELGLGR